MKKSTQDFFLVLATIMNVNGMDFNYDKMIEAINEWVNVKFSVKPIAEWKFFRGLEAVFRRIINPFLHPEWIYKRTNLYRAEMESRTFYYAIGDELIAQVREQIRQDRAQNKKSSIKYMVEFLLDENGMRYSNIEIREHIFTLLGKFLQILVIFWYSKTIFFSHWGRNIIKFNIKRHSLSCNQ